MKTSKMFLMGLLISVATVYSCSKSELKPSSSPENVSASTNKVSGGNDCGYLCTFTQGGYGAKNGQPHDYLYAYFNRAFPNGVAIGSKGCTNGKGLIMTTAKAVTDNLPVGGTPAVLLADYRNSTPKNVLVGQLITLSLNVGFDNYDPTFGPSDVSLRNMIIGSGPFQGKTVGQFLSIANQVIGGCNNTYSPSTINETATNINESFDYDNGSHSTTGFLVCP